MKTPYDTALRLQRREVDAVKVSISVEIERITTLEQQARTIDSRVVEERRLAHALPLSSDHWVARMRAERARVEHAARESQARLNQLRDQAIEAYGTMRAIESAATRYRDEAERAADVAEQSAIDDIAAVRFLNARRRRRAA